MFIVAALLTVRALAQADVESVRAQLVGVYTLIEYAAHGDEPTGRIWYEPSGQMSAMLFPPGREPLANDASAEDFRASMRGLVAYYGSYTIDPVAGTVTHHIEGASNPAWLGDNFVRWYRFEGGNLRLSLSSNFGNTLLWQRLPVD
jgi:hypothetical protein